MNRESKILGVPYIRDLFEGVVEPLFRWESENYRIIVYSSKSRFEEERRLLTLGILDHRQDCYFEVTFQGDAIVNCRKYTPDFYSHGTAFQQFKDKFFDLLCEVLSPEIKRQLFSLFLPADQGVDRHVGGFVLFSIDSEGCYHEKQIEVENKYL